MSKQATSGMKVDVKKILYEIKHNLPACYMDISKLSEPYEP